MASKNQNLSSVSGEFPDAKGLHIGVVVSEWNREITTALEKACVEALTSFGCNEEDIQVIYVPGAFELPLGARLLSSKDRFDAFICLGCVIKGETKHDEYISQAVANGIMQLNVMSGKPVVFGLLTPNDYEQALDRAGGKHGNKGVEAATTAVKMATLAKAMKDPKKSIGY